MNKFIVGATVVVLLLVLFASAYAFSTSLRTLRLNASGLTLTAATESAAPMTYADESQISAPQADMVRFQTIQEPERLCQRDRTAESTVGF